MGEMGDFLQTIIEAEFVALPVTLVAILFPALLDLSLPRRSARPAQRIVARLTFAVIAGYIPFAVLLALHDEGSYSFGLTHLPQYVPLGLWVLAVQCTLLWTEHTAQNKSWFRCIRDAAGGAAISGVLATIAILSQYGGGYSSRVVSDVLSVHAFVLVLVHAMIVRPLRMRQLGNEWREQTPE